MTVASFFLVIAIWHQNAIAITHVPFYGTMERCMEHTKNLTQYAAEQKVENSILFFCIPAR